MVPESAQKERFCRLTTPFAPRLLLDSRVVDKTMSYNPICASCILLEALIFQEPYKCVACFRRPCEYKTLKPNKSHREYKAHLPTGGVLSTRPGKPVALRSATTVPVFSRIRVRGYTGSQT